MKTTGLSELEAVMSVARHRSFRAAANELNLSTSALSHAVAALEARIGVRLFNRTTRSVSLSEAGAQFVASIAPALSTIQTALDEAGTFRDTPSGTLRINTSLGAAHQVMPVMLDFSTRFPDVKLDIVTEGRLIDIVVEGFDAGIRLMESVPQDMIAVPFGDRQRFAVVGSPEYFAQNKPPRVPADLLKHRCIRARMASGTIYQWEFERRGQMTRVDVAGPITLDDGTLMLRAARAGAGLTYLSEWSVRDDLASGTLVRVLEDWTPPLEGLALYYPGRRHVPAALRALIDVIREHAEVQRSTPVQKRSTARKSSGGPSASRG